MYKFLNEFLLRTVRSLKTRFLIFKDELEVYFGLRHRLMPPKRYDYINIGINNEINKEFFKYFIEKGDLKITDSILEVGSGFGRMAIPLTQFLSSDGSYNGLEIIKDGVNWCRSKFTPKFPNFQFQRIDVFNERYNPSGNFSAGTYEFPFEDKIFDFVFLTSVFTHMYPKDLENYLSEISRVLKNGGQCFITYYLLNETSLNNIAAHRGTYNFKYQVEDYRLEDKANPLYQIAFKEDVIKKMYKKFDLKIKEPINYGNWSGRKDYLSFQDVIIGKKV